MLRLNGSNSTNLQRKAKPDTFDPPVAQTSRLGVFEEIRGPKKSNRRRGKGHKEINPEVSLCLEESEEGDFPWPVYPGTKK